MLLPHFSFEMEEAPLLRDRLALLTRIFFQFFAFTLLFCILFSKVCVDTLFQSQLDQIQPDLILESSSTLAWKVGTVARLGEFRRNTWLSVALHRKNIQSEVGTIVGTNVQ